MYLLNAQKLKYDWLLVLKKRNKTVKRGMRNNRSRCIASVGTRISGLLTLTSLCRNEPSASLRMTLPANVRSLSNHVCHNPPPYVWTFTIWWPDLKEADRGFSLRHGLSVWAAIILKPLPTLYLQNKGICMYFRLNMHLYFGVHKIWIFQRCFRYWAIIVSLKLVLFASLI